MPNIELRKCKESILILNGHYKVGTCNSVFTDGGIIQLHGITLYNQFIDFSRSKTNEALRLVLAELNEETIIPIPYTVVVNFGVGIINGSGLFIGASESTFKTASFLKTTSKNAN